VSTTSSPGQIIIPLAVVPYLPPVGPRITTPTGAQQAEAHFDLSFIDGTTVITGPARLIRYEPAPTHARSNIENRFTFLNRTINPGGILNQDDILLFEPLQPNPTNVALQVHRIVPTDPRYLLLTGGTQRTFGVYP
jgi:hypothetical protein